MRYCGYALLGAVVLVAADLAMIRVLAPGRHELLPLVAIVATFALAIFAVLVVMATYALIRSRLRRLSR